MELQQWISTPGWAGGEQRSGGGRGRGLGSQSRQSAAAKDGWGKAFTEEWGLESRPRRPADWDMKVCKPLEL